MKVKNISILEALKYKNNKVLCLIKLCPRYIKYFHGQLAPHKTYHWMEAEHWASFDSGLEKILDENIAEFKVKDNLEATKGKRFQLNSLISVSVSVSSIPIKTLCLCAYGNNVSGKDVVLALECHIEFSDERNSNDELKSQTLKEEDIKNNHEYEPQVLSFQSETDRSLKKKAISPPLYTPSPKNKSYSSEINGLNIDEERYSPKPIDDIVDYVPSQLQVPKYNPSRIAKKVNSSIEVKTYDEGNEKISCHPEENQITQKKQYKRRRGKPSKTQEETVCASNEKLDDVTMHKEMCSSEEKSVKSDKNSKNYVHIDDLSSSLSDIPSLGEKCERISKIYHENIITLGPRRSTRSPIKPNRLVETMQSEKKKYKIKSLKAKTANKSENLFGSDDEDFVRKTHETPSVIKPHPTIANSSVKKRKRDQQTPNCDQEKQCMTTWLGKKRDEEKSVSGKCNAKKHKSSRIDSPIPTKNDPLTNISIAQLDEQIRKEKLQTEHNLKLKKVLEEMIQPDPKAVEILSLHDMTKNEILDTFTQYKSVLDEVFEKSHRKANVYGNDGIDHYTVMRLIDHNMQLDMMTKLSEIYENQDEGPSAYAKLYANAILPEWLISIFMDKYHFTRNEAIQQVKAQESYKLHLAAKSDDAIEFD